MNGESLEVEGSTVKDGEDAVDSLTESWEPSAISIGMFELSELYNNSLSQVGTTNTESGYGCF